MGGKSQKAEDNSAESVVVPQPASSPYEVYPQSLPGYSGGAQSFQAPAMIDNIPGQRATISEQLNYAFPTVTGGALSSGGVLSPSPVAPPSSGSLALGNLNEGKPKGILDINDQPIKLNEFGKIDYNPVIGSQPAPPKILTQPLGANINDVQEAMNILPDWWWGTR